MAKEKYLCPICEKDIDVRTLTCYKLDDEEENNNALSLELLIKGICPVCGYIVKATPLNTLI